MLRARAVAALITAGIHSREERADSYKAIWSLVAVVPSSHPIGTQSPLTAHESRTSLLNRRILRAVEAVHDAPGQQWTVSGLANVAGMSRTAFSVRFRDMIGITPLRYVGGTRLQIASVAIEDKKSILEVALFCGYGSEAAFGRAFKRFYGVTPGRWRTKLLALNGNGEISPQNPQWDFG
jgi:transcriptional regulator GlxA family with amidase domain